MILPDPMLLSEGTVSPLDKPGWIYEVKYDGWRLMAAVAAGQVHIRTRGGADYTRVFPEVVEALKSLPGGPHILDGEGVVLYQARPRAVAVARLLPSPTGDNAARRWKWSRVPRTASAVGWTRDQCATGSRAAQRRSDAYEFLGVRHSEQRTAMFLAAVVVCGSGGRIGQGAVRGLHSLGGQLRQGSY